MKKIPTPKELLELIKTHLFEGIDLSIVLTMDAAQLRTFTLEQEERLLADAPYGETAARLSDLFWTADKDYIMMYENHPWLADNEMDLKSREELSDFSDDEYRLAQWLLELAMFSHDLFVHSPFYLNILLEDITDPEAREAFDFSYSHKALINWIRTTPYRRIAALACYLVLDEESNKAIQTNQTIQDFYAMECWRELHTDWQDLENCEKFTTKALDAMQQIEEHYEKGHAAGLNDEEIRVLDALYGFVPHEFFEEDFLRVRDICEAANKHLPSKPYIKSEQGQRQYGKAVFDDLKEVFAKYDIPYDPSDLTDLTLSYLDAWVYDKYYE